MLVTNSDLQLEVVAVTVGRKTLAKRREIRGTQGTTEHAVAIAGLQQRIAEEIQYLAVAAVGVTLAVLADAIHSGDETQVLDGACRQQPVPGIAPGSRPVRGVEQQIGAVRVAAPLQKTKVVADQRSHPPTIQLEQRLPLARRVMLVFAGHAEQMALVVMQDFAVRPGPEQAVAVAA